MKDHLTPNEILYYNASGKPVTKKEFEKICDGYGIQEEDSCLDSEGLAKIIFGISISAWAVCAGAIGIAGRLIYNICE